MCAALPFYAMGKVTKGFGRGSKSLGIPTANFGPEIVEKLPEEFETGIYFGWAKVNEGPVNKMVISIGWNPYFKNEQKSMETHIMQTFEEDFYDQNLRICITGYLRPEKNFNSLDELIVAIKEDIKNADQELDKPEYKKFKRDPFFCDADDCCKSPHTKELNNSTTDTTDST